MTSSLTHLQLWFSCKRKKTPINSVFCFVFNVHKSKRKKPRTLGAFGYWVRRFVQILSPKSIISLPHRYLEPPSIPLMQSKWPNPLQWIRPCNRCVWRSMTWLAKGLFHSLSIGIIKWYFRFDKKWWLQPINQNNHSQTIIPTSSISMAYVTVIPNDQIFSLILNTDYCEFADCSPHLNWSIGVCTIAKFTNCKYLV